MQQSVQLMSMDAVVVESEGWLAPAARADKIASQSAAKARSRHCYGGRLRCQEWMQNHCVGEADGQKSATSRAVEPDLVFAEIRAVVQVGRL